MTPVRISIAAAIGSVLLILVVLELIRGRRLKERYALLWLVTGFVLLVLSAWRGGLNTIAGWLGVSGYPPAILFAAAIMFVIAVLLHYSTVKSRNGIRPSWIAVSNRSNGVTRISLRRVRYERREGEHERTRRADDDGARGRVSRPHGGPRGRRVGPGAAPPPARASHCRP